MLPVQVLVFLCGCLLLCIFFEFVCKNATLTIVVRFLQMLIIIGHYEVRQ